MAELQKEEEEENPRSVPDGAAPPAGVAADVSHPYYDVARHGIIQVSGVFGPKLPVSYALQYIIAVVQCLCIGVWSKPPGSVLLFNTVRHQQLSSRVASDFQATITTAGS